MSMCKEQRGWWDCDLVGKEWLGIEEERLAKVAAV